MMISSMRLRNSGRKYSLRRKLDFVFGLDVVGLLRAARHREADLLHLVDVLRADVAGHDDDRVAEVDLAAFGVGQTDRCRNALGAGKC